MLFTSILLGGGPKYKHGLSRDVRLRWYITFPPQFVFYVPLGALASPLPIPLGLMKTRTNFIRATPNFRITNIVINRTIWSLGFLQNAFIYFSREAHNRPQKVNIPFISETRIIIPIMKFFSRFELHAHTYKDVFKHLPDFYPQKKTRQFQINHYKIPKKYKTNYSLL